MTRYKLSIDTDNAAFGERNVSRGAELARILRDLARRLEEDGASENEDRKLRDANGNTAGEFKTETRAHAHRSTRGRP